MAESLLPVVERANKQKGHRRRPNWRSLPTQQNVPRLQAPTALNAGCLALLPPPMRQASSHAAILSELFQNRVALVTIRQWRRGIHRPPQWAVDLLLDVLYQRRAALDHAIALLKNEKGR